jgi:hypothetical protein
MMVLAWPVMMEVMAPRPTPPVLAERGAKTETVPELPQPGGGGGGRTAQSAIQAMSPAPPPPPLGPGPMIARSATIRIVVPAPSLDATLASLKQLGQVVAESQGGDVVSEQVVDIAARLANARQHRVAADASDS